MIGIADGPWAYRVGPWRSARLLRSLRVYLDNHNRKLILTTCVVVEGVTAAP
jgi:hypothetical protein